MTGGSGMNHMECDINKADRLGDKSGRSLFLKNPGLDEQLSRGIFLWTSWNGKVSKRDSGQRKWM